jgi:hypothetical protein
LDITTLKAKLGDETFAQLETYVNELVSQRNQARDESISGRKTLKTKVTEQEALIGRMLEKLGLDSPDGLDDLPDARGQGEAVKQLEAKLKRFERERAEAISARDQLEGKWRDSRKAAAVAAAIGKHQWIDTDAAGVLLERSLRWEGDELLCDVEGRLVPLEEGAAHLAKSRPALVKAAGAGGSGYRPGGGAAPATTKNPFARETFNLTEQIALRKENPQLAEQLKAAAAN